MTKTIKTILLLIIIIFSFQFFVPNTLAQETLEFTPQVPIPGEDSEFREGQENIPVGKYGQEFIDIGPEGKEKRVEVTTVYSTILPKYIRAIYNYGIGIAAFLALAMIVAGGLIWLTSAGSTEKISTARSMIVSAIIGLVLLLGTYTLLQIISPDLTNFKAIKTEYVSPIELACCEFSDEDRAETMTEAECAEAGGEFIEGNVASDDRTVCVDMDAQVGCCLFDQDENGNYQQRVEDQIVERMCNFKGDDAKFRKGLWAVEVEEGNYYKCSASPVRYEETDDNGCYKTMITTCYADGNYQCPDEMCSKDINDENDVCCCPENMENECELVTQDSW